MPKLSIDEIPVTDAKKSLVLHILPTDCKDGDPKHPATCAAARAIKREVGAIDCRVHLGRVYIRQNKGNWQRYATPKNLRTEIIAFDRGGSFEPGEYTLTPLQPSQKAANRKPGRKAKRPGSMPQRGNRTKRHLVANVRNGPA